MRRRGLDQRAPRGGWLPEEGAHEVAVRGEHRLRHSPLGLAEGDRRRLDEQPAAPRQHPEPRFHDLGIGFAWGTPTNKHATGAIYTTDFGLRRRLSAAGSFSGPGPDL